MTKVPTVCVTREPMVSALTAPLVDPVGVVPSDDPVFELAPLPPEDGDTLVTGADGTAEPGDDAPEAPGALDCTETGRVFAAALVAGVPLPVGGGITTVEPEGIEEPPGGGGTACEGSTSAPLPHPICEPSG